MKFYIEPTNPKLSIIRALENDEQLGTIERQSDGGYLVDLFSLSSFERGTFTGARAKIGDILATMPDPPKDTPLTIHQIDIASWVIRDWKSLNVGEIHAMSNGRFKIAIMGGHHWTEKTFTSARKTAFRWLEEDLS